MNKNEGMKPENAKALRKTSDGVEIRNYDFGNAMNIKVRLSSPEKTRQLKIRREVKERRDEQYKEFRCGNKKKVS